MDFLDRFTGRDRDRLAAVASTVRLAKGELLLRRGDRGGDLFRVAEGELEVIDTRSQPAVVLDVIGRGSLVGEMSFLDESARSADVRAQDGAVCQRWDRGQLLRLLDSDPPLAASFYRVIAALVTERQRTLSTHAMAGTLGVAPRRANAEVGQVAHGLAASLRDRLMEAEPLIRRDRPAAQKLAQTALHNFASGAAEALSRLSAGDAADAGEVLARELHPYLIRSHLGEFCLDRPSGHASDPQAVSHVVANVAEGDGPLGEILDEWLLGLPTARGIRERTALAAELVMERLPPDGTLRMVLVNVGTGQLLGALLPHLDRLRGEIVCVDGTREALAATDRRLAGRTSDLRVRLVQDDLGMLCLGRSRMRYGSPELIVIDGLLDHTPERVAASLLTWAATQLAPLGQVLATALEPTADDFVFRHLLRWPTVRHRAAGLRSLCGGTGLGSVHTWRAGGAGLVAGAAAGTLEDELPQEPTGEIAH